MHVHTYTKRARYRYTAASLTSLSQASKEYAQAPGHTLRVSASGHYGAPRARNRWLGKSTHALVRGYPKRNRDWNISWFTCCDFFFLTHTHTHLGQAQHFLRGRDVQIPWPEEHRLSVAFSHAFTARHNLAEARIIHVWKAAGDV